MNWRRGENLWQTRWLPIALMFALRLWTFHYWPHCSEDAYITFHAAKDREWLDAATSPVWTGFLALGNLVHIPPPFLARLAILVADAGVVAAMVGLGANVWLFCGLWSLPFMLGSSLSGLETHIAASAFVMSLRWDWPLTLMACLRPDTAVMALVASGKRWRYALVGTAVMIVGSLIATGNFLPHTMISKLESYGVGWFAGKAWFFPYGLGWPFVGLAVLALFSRRWLYVAAALGPILTYFTLGTPAGFWWYAVPSVGMLIALCSLNRNRFAIAAAAMVCAGNLPYMVDRLSDRVMQEGNLWKTGQRLAQYNAQGTVMLEPAGMIPYLNPSLKVVDEIGLVCPPMAEYRVRVVNGWFGDAVATFKPEWIITRTRFLNRPLEEFSGVGKPFRNLSEFGGTMGAYKIMDIPSGISRIGTKDGKSVKFFRFRSGDLVIFRRK